MPAENEIFFSYAWADEKEEGESREKIVDDLYESLKQDGFKVVRDKNNLGYRGYISDFMTSIGKGKKIVIVISRKYIKSQFCMFELYEVMRNCRFDKHEFSKRTLPFVIEFIDFKDTKIQEEYLSYWDDKYDKYKALAKKRAGQLSIEWQAEFDRIKMIYQNFSKLIGWITDMNTATTSMLSAENFAEIKKAVGEDIIAEQDNNVKNEDTHQPEKNTVTINNAGAKIAQQNVNSTVDNKGANFNF